MLKDISHWEWSGYGGKGTLEKEELVSPNGRYYFIKYPRNFKQGVSWEDITELIASKIGNLLDLDMMQVEIVTRNGRRGCLLKNFTRINDDAMENEEGGSLLNISSDYSSLLSTSLKGIELIDLGFQVIKQLPYWQDFKLPFIKMQYFDILIGNQDRHPFNWILLFKTFEKVTFSPLYDNGASLGFRFDDQLLTTMTANESKLLKYMRKTRVKAGLFERKSVSAIELVKYLIRHYPKESNIMYTSIQTFDHQCYIIVINHSF